MRKPYACLGTALVAVVLPFLAHAQFQKPTSAELKMTSDPKAPGAAAVYLDIQETTDDNLHFKTLYARIKVLTEKGKSLASVHIPYSGPFRVSDIQGRTIHPDGTIVPLVGKPADLLGVKTGDMQSGEKVFTLPSVTVGSILEYRYNLTYPEYWVSSPQWDIQRDYFVHQEDFTFLPFASFIKQSGSGTNAFLYDPVTKQNLDTLIWWAHLPLAPSVSPKASSAASPWT